eukprot:TRINITY_DN9379_c0_g1_i2.p1 TRINITY_DN9379_c0_g1~~TRINITY_DN9379_c0_g1_i2.p1  ORF type:complete len:205 (-),score=2.90 TRINITY_DN9379_c0_g1_i2:17-631(-)
MPWRRYFMMVPSWSCIEKLAISAGPEFDPERWRQGRSAAMAHLEALVNEFIGDKAPSDRDGGQSASADQSNTGVAHVILADDNMHYRRMRHDVLQLARRRGCAFAVVYLPMDAATAEQRNASRHKPVPDDVIGRMAHALEPPDPETVPWERYCATVSDSADDGQVDAGTYRIVIETLSDCHMTRRLCTTSLTLVAWAFSRPERE